MDINELFVFAEYVEEKYFGIQHYDEESENASGIIITAAKKKPGIATKTNPSLWSRCKSEAKSRMGGKHSARAMQLALKLYKKRGGGFRGPKPNAKTNKMKKWTKQKWMYLSDYKKSKNKADDGLDISLNDDFDSLYLDINESNSDINHMDLDSLLNNELYAKDTNLAKGRYLPQEKWKALSPKEREATDRKKKQEGKNKQYVPNTEKAKVKSKAKYY